MSERALAEVDRILTLGSDPDDVLRAVVATLAAEPGLVWAGIVFLEGGTPILGPEAGVAAPTRRIDVPVVYQGTIVGRLAVDGDAEPALLAESQSASRRTCCSDGYGRRGLEVRTALGSDLSLTPTPLGRSPRRPP